MTETHACCCLVSLLDDGARIAANSGASPEAITAAVAEWLAGRLAQRALGRLREQGIAPIMTSAELMAVMRGAAGGSAPSPLRGNDYTRAKFWQFFVGGVGAHILIISKRGHPPFVITFARIGERL